MKKNTGSANYTRDNLFKITDYVNDSGEPYVITKNGKPVVTMMPSKKYDELKGLVINLQSLLVDTSEEKRTGLDSIYRSVKPKYKSSLTEKEIEKAAKEDHVELSEEKLKKQWQNII